ncbi:mannose-6-phosphate isomerase [Condylostylus longicornis]|uniref:mannose-6-phosphate isomerase n=1 Tax=Condylostylus longicornis TaxID=2530218 RepID=UPI00244DB64F|nr:mannose-6-phosphate isomerase [Condylostylus longicornis]XP_055376559.1 mannose-6-phosphate isomerase [Condylostylus longicornis]
MELIGSVKTSEWGKIGNDSEVCRIAQLNYENFQVNASTPYAEFWMGDHENGPSLIKSSKETLSSFLDKSSKNLIGGHQKLSFLLKILSVSKALSIQVHPNKEEAKRLHEERPDIYKDPNHKPELAIALTPFIALCGFRPYNEIQGFLDKILPLSNLIGNQNVQKLNEGESGLKACYTQLMTASSDKISECIEAISKNYNETLAEYKLYKIFNKMNREFPKDVGILSLFFLNVIRLKPGESIFLPANLPHAYLEGDCIECMSCSDNVIRAGLTPKFKDVPTLLGMLNYKGEPAEEKLFKPDQRDEHVQIFAPKIEDFAVVKFHFTSDIKEYKWKNIEYGSILLVLEGERILRTETLGDIKLYRGSVIFIPGNCGNFINFVKSDNYQGNFTSYLASYNNF